MDQKTNKADNLKIDWIKVQKGIYGIWEMADVQTDEVYGSAKQIIKNFPEPQRTHELRERNIFFGETVKYLYKLTLMDVESYKFKLEGEKTVEDHLEEIKKMDNVVIWD